MMKLVKQAIWMVAVFGLVMVVIPGGASWDQFTFAISKMSISVAVLTVTMLFATLMIYYRLKYWPFWTVVLVFLALFGSGVDLPPFLVLFPYHMSAGSVALTLAAVSVFWGIEKLVAMHEGSENSAVRVGDSFADPDEMITLNLTDTIKPVSKHP